MATNYPGSLDNSTSLPNPGATDDTNSPSLSSGQTVQNGAVIAVETKVGTGSSSQAAVANSVLIGDGAGTSHWGPVTSSQVSSTTGTGAFVLANGATMTSPTINTATINNPTLKVDSIAGFTTSTVGTAWGVSFNNSAITAGAISGSGLTITNNASFGGNLTFVTASGTSSFKAASGTSIPAGGTAGLGYTLSSTANYGVFFGSGAPTLTAAQGSLYLRSDGSSTSTRMYVNSNGGTTWTNVVTAA